MSASTFKVQRIRSCTQCGTVLALKCKACVKHPERKPRVVELYDWPEILKTAECGCCILIRCQLPGCVKTMWRNVKHNRDGKAASKGSFCSTPCSARSMAAARVTRQTVPCDWCSKPVTKKSYALKTWTKSYCNNTCYFLRRAKDAHSAKVAKDGEKSATDRGLLECTTCSKVKGRDAIQEHLTPRGGLATCLGCGVRRGVPGAAISGGEAAAIRKAEASRP